MHERLGDGLAQFQRPALAHDDELFVHGGDRLDVGQRSGVLLGLGVGQQLDVAGAQHLGALGQPAHAAGEGVGGERPFLERRHPALDGGLDLAQLGRDGGRIGLVSRRCHGRVTLLSRCGVEKGGRLGVEVDQRVENGTLQGVGAHGLGLARLPAAAVAAPAGVVPVALGAAAGRHADVSLGTAAAADEPGQQVLAVPRPEPAVVILASGCERGLHPVEHRRVEEGVLGASVPGAPEEHLADIGAVAEHLQQHLAAPQLAGSGAQPRLVQLAGQRGAADDALGVATEDPLDRRELLGHRCEPPVVVEAEAVGEPPSGPAAAGRLALHAVDDAVDDRGPLELGEDA
ncbi:MAG TPA: hypothetical protein VM938_03105 [Acidimicrobiales bacterium]|nr:hypothetical protein [Acidimicrobiales bacterium]